MSSESEIDFTHFIYELFLNELLHFILGHSRLGSFLGGSAVKNPSAMQETRFSPQVWEDPWKTKRQSTPNHSYGESHEQKNYNELQSMG